MIAVPDLVSSFLALYFSNNDLAFKLDFLLKLKFLKERAYTLSGKLDILKRIKVLILDIYMNIVLDLCKLVVVVRFWLGNTRFVCAFFIKIPSGMITSGRTPS